MIEFADLIFELVLVMYYSKINKKMLKILRRHAINIQNFSNELQSHKLKIDPRYVRTILQFDGSMTKFVMNMTGEGSKPLVKIILQREVSLKDMYERMEDKNEEKQTLFDLQKVFAKDSHLDMKEENSTANLIERSIAFYIEKEKSLSEPKLLYFARSFWDVQKYDQIMSKNLNKPIGLNLIDQQVQLFRKINWVGFADLEIALSSQEKQPQVYQNLCSRSYSMISKGSPLCELEEFFLPEMFDIFK